LRKLCDLRNLRGLEIGIDADVSVDEIMEFAVIVLKNNVKMKAVWFCMTKNHVPDIKVFGELWNNMWIREITQSCRKDKKAGWWGAPGFWFGFSLEKSVLLRHKMFELMF